MSDLLLRRLLVAAPALLLCTGLLVSQASADVVVLEGGETIEGIVRESGTQVIVELDVGSISLDRASVKEIRKSRTKLDELRTRRSAIAFNDVSALFELAAWASREGLTTQAHAIAREILKLDDDHAGARAMLGYEKHGGRWLTEEEHMTETGHVRYEGAWIKAEEARRLQDERRERELARAKEARLASMERQVAEAQRQAAEAKDEAERARRDAEEAKQSRWFLSGGNGFWPHNPYPRVYPNRYPTVPVQTPAPRPKVATPATPPPAGGGSLSKRR